MRPEPNDAVQARECSTDKGFCAVFLKGFIAMILIKMGIRDLFFRNKPTSYGMALGRVTLVFWRRKRPKKLSH
jgi:xanthine/uracil/vitamin C permease (AzgA family)